jgi:hypothetical protein
VATSYLLGVSTRRMEKLVEQLGITRLCKSQVSEMAKDLDGQVEAFRTRPLDAGPYTFVAADALVLKVREGGRTVNVHALLAIGVQRRRVSGDPRPARPLGGGRRRLLASQLVREPGSITAARLKSHSSMRASRRASSPSASDGLGCPSRLRSGSAREPVIFPSNHGGFLGGEYGQTGEPDAFACKLCRFSLRVPDRSAVAAVDSGRALKFHGKHLHVSQFTGC